MAKFVKLTRVFKYKDSNTINFQSLSVNAEAVATVRASNRLGHPDHRTTIELMNGTTYDIAETSSAVKKALGIRD